MPEYAAQITATIGAAPEALLDFYDDADQGRIEIPVYPNSRINCLPFEKARAYTENMRGIPVVDRLGLWILDNANDSNPFAYISKGPCSGMIIHFSHDPEPEIVYSSLPKFIATLHDAGQRELDIDNLEKETIHVPLERDIRALSAVESNEATFLLNLYLPVSEALHQETVATLASHRDFFVREALAAFITHHASADYSAVAEKLSLDKHPQVAREGLRAVGAIKRESRAG